MKRLQNESPGLHNQVTKRGSELQCALDTRDVVDRVFDFVSISESQCMRCVSKTFNESVVHRTVTYTTACRVIQRFARSYNFNQRENDLDEMTKRTLIRLYVRTYNDQWVHDLWTWSFPKIRGLVNPVQQDSLSSFIHQNPYFNRKYMRQYLHILPKEQILYMGY